MASTFHVANYPGINGVVRGIDLMDNMKTSRGFLTVIDDMKEVTKLNLEGRKAYKNEDTDYYAGSYYCNRCYTQKTSQKEKGSLESWCALLCHI